MDLNWITSPLTTYALMAAGWVATFGLVLTAKVDGAQAEKRLSDELQRCNEKLDRLTGRMEEFAAELAESPSGQVALRPEGLNMQKRSEALRMYRRGSDPEAVEAALKLSPAEVALLHKVHRALSGEEEPELTD